MPGGPLAAPLAERAGCERLAPGVASLPCEGDRLNAAGTLNGGLIALVVEEAALSAAGRPEATLAVLSLRYLRPVRVGPAVARATVRAGVGEVVVTDRGRDDALAVLATTRTFDEPPR